MQKNPKSRSDQGMPVVMTIAGSDSGGGAGIQADLKTFQRFGAFGASAITCLTAQNPDIVRAIFPIPRRMVALQIATVCEAFRVSAAKTGMLYSATIIAAVADAVVSAGIPILVVDPVMVSTSGSRLLRADAMNALRSRLLPLATVVTPNIPEAETLCGFKITSVAGMRRAARTFGQRYGTSCVVKGGNMEGKSVVDVLFVARPRKGCKNERVSSVPRVKNANTHGTGCMFSAALAALLAKGASLADSAWEAQRFVKKTIRSATPGMR